MDCGATCERLSEYLDEVLSPSDTQRVAAHLSTCKACRSQLDDLRVTKGVLAIEPVPMPSEGFWERMHADVRSHSASVPAPRGAARPWQEWFGLKRPIPRALAAAVVLAVLVLATVFMRPGAPPAAPDDVDDYIAQHAEHSAAYPMSDWSRMTFVSSEVNAAQTGGQ